MKKLKLHYILLLLSFTCVLGGKKIPDDNSELRFRTACSHTYTKTGLLDTSFGTSYMYSRRGIDSISYIVVRKYGKNAKIIDEKTFQFADNSIGELISAVATSYNENDSVVRVTILGNTSRSTIVNEYDSKKRLILSHSYTSKNSASFTKKLNSDIAPLEDTIERIYEYNDRSAVAKIYTTDYRTDDVIITNYVYSGDVQKYSFEIAKNGDTISRVVYITTGQNRMKISHFSSTTDTTFFEAGLKTKQVSFNTKTKIRYNRIFLQ